MPEEIIDSLINGLQSYDKFETLNPVEISIKSNTIVADLNRCKCYMYFFLMNSLLLSARNNTNVIFISFNGLNDVKESLIHGKIYKTIGVINLDQIHNWKIKKGESIYVNTNLIDSYYPENADHFVFAFETKSIDLLNVSFSLLDVKSGLINFLSDEQKIPLIGFTIQIIR